MASERLQGDEKLYSKNYLLEMPHFHAKMRLKSAPQNLNFLMAKDISKSYTLNCSCMLMPFPVPAYFKHSNAASFSIKITLGENTNIFLARTIESLVK